MSPKTASSSAVTNSDGSSWTAVTAVVLCAVRATTTLMPWQPADAKAFRSAWIPAPPPESDVAIVSARGTDIVSLRRHDPDQVRRGGSQPRPGPPGGCTLATMPHTGAAPQPLCPFQPDVDEELQSRHRSAEARLARPR